MSRNLLLLTSGGPSPRPQLFNAATSGTSEAISFQNAHKVAAFIQIDGSPTAGEIVFESSITNNFTGTWAQEGNAVFTLNTATQDRIQVEGPLQWGRLRIKTPFVGGTVSAWVEAIGKD